MIDKYDIERLEMWLRLAKTKGTDAIKVVAGDEINTYKVTIAKGGSDPEPRQHYEVHCGKCHWWGMLEQLKTIYKSNPAEPEDVIPEPCCPMCLSDQWLEYKED